MRITPRERAAVKRIVQQLDKRAKVYLYGSRTNNSLRGGDIDLLIISDRLLLADKLDILIQMKDALGEQKMDILIKTAKDSLSDPFTGQILKSAILL